MAWADLENYVKLFASLGVIAGLGAAIRYAWGKQRWRNFKRKCKHWYLAAESLHPKQMSEDDLGVLVEEWLSDSWFSPFEIQTLHSLASVTAKGILAKTML